MKFGLEAEKFLFNKKTLAPSEGVFSFLDGLSDLRGYSNQNGAPSKITNEFVLSMVELGTTPSTSLVNVIKDYLFHYLMIKKVARRENVAIVSLASLPMDYMPHMASKWSYYLQNSVLAEQRKSGWIMDERSPLRAAGNCAGVHVHAELETLPEFHFTSRELMDKFNMGLMMSPMIAFGSSPYFFGEHEAHSMRAMRYYFGTYRGYPLNGHLPPVMKSSADVLRFFQSSIDLWISRATGIGFKEEEVQAQVFKKGANWNPVRWNRSWNTIEIRCLESDSVELDCSKFVWICSAMRRLDLKGEALQCRTIESERALDHKMIEDALLVSGKEVNILPTHAMNELFERAVHHGTKDEFVESYLHRLKDFAKVTITPEEEPYFKTLESILENHETTSEHFLARTQHASQITYETAVDLVMESISHDEDVVKELKEEDPELFTRLQEMLPQI